MKVPELIANVRTGLVQIFLERNRERLGAGSGFLTDAGLVTNRHVVPPGGYEAVALRLADTDPENPASYIRIAQADMEAALVTQSPEDEADFATFKLQHDEFVGCHRFGFDPSNDRPPPGEQVLFLGFPFGMPQLTAHLGYVSAHHRIHKHEAIQIDGSVNGGNSGGPLLHLPSGLVTGVVTRAVTGFIEQQFDALLKSLRENQKALQAARGGISVGGIDPMDALRASQAAMERIALDLRRSANVGIGYAFSIRYLRDALSSLKAV